MESQIHTEVGSGCSTSRGKSMTRRSQFVLVLACALLIAAGISHFLIHCFGMEDKPMAHKLLGGLPGEPMAFVAGSSLMQDGLSWSEIAEALDCRMETW